MFDDDIENKSVHSFKIIAGYPVRAAQTFLCQEFGVCGMCSYEEEYFDLDLDTTLGEDLECTLYSFEALMYEWDAKGFAYQNSLLCDSSLCTVRCYA